jgi:hypothetical protein
MPPNPNLNLNPSLGVQHLAVTLLTAENLV